VRFAHPELLWLILLLPPMFVAGWWSAVRSGRALRRFAGGPRLVSRFTGEVSVHRRAAKLLLLYFALACVILAAARPQWGTRLEPITRSGADVVVLLDTSLSMAAEDLAPNRLEQARNGIDQLLRRLSGDRVGLITFAGRATVACPLTLDQAAVRLFLHVVQVETVQVPGTALAEALGLAVQSFGDEPAVQAERGRAVVLFSDGEDHEGGLDEVLEELRDNGIVVYSVGCGTTRGAPIPMRDAAGISTGYKKDHEDKIVTTRLDEGVLERLALETGGNYFRGTAMGQEIDQIAEGLSSMEAGELGTVLRARYEERFQIPLAAALLALLAESLLGDRRKRSEIGETT
jgi:Ca-activated chloride channel family protein